MSLPPIPRPSTSLPPLNSAPARERPAAPELPLTRQEKRRAEEQLARTPEVLVITVEDDVDSEDAISVSFEGAGFDVSNDEIVLDLLRLAVNTYGYDLVEMPAGN